MKDLNSHDLRNQSQMTYSGRIYSTCLTGLFSLGAIVNTDLSSS